MQPDTDPIHHLTDADRDTETRFGTRKVPEGHKTAAPYPHRPMRASRIPPSSEEAYAGQKRREASLTAKLVVLGGAGIMAAAATAAAVMVGRRLGDVVGGDARDGALSGGEPRRRPLAPRFAEMDEETREAVRRRDRDRALRERNRISRMRAMAARERVAPRKNVARELRDTANDLSGSLNGVMASLTGALTGFRQVSAQAGGIMREFSNAADLARSFLDEPVRRRDPEGDRAERRDGDRKPRP